MLIAPQDNCGAQNLVTISYDAFAVTINSASFGYFKGESRLGYGGGHVESSVNAPVSVGKLIESSHYDMFFWVLFVYFFFEAIIELRELLGACAQKNVYYFLDGFNLLDLGFLFSYACAAYSFLRIRRIYKVSAILTVLYSLYCTHCTHCAFGGSTRSVLYSLYCTHCTVLTVLTVHTADLQGQCCTHCTVLTVLYSLYSLYCTHCTVLTVLTVLTVHSADLPEPHQHGVALLRGQDALLLHEQESVRQPD
jgi:hypothetical protein